MQSIEGLSTTRLRHTATLNPCVGISASQFPMRKACLRATLRNYPTGTGLVRATAFSTDRCILVSGNYDGTAGYWVNLHALASPLEPQLGGINAVAFSPDNKELAIGGGTELELWDISRPSHPQLGSESQSLTGYNSWITSLTFSPDKTILISGSADDTVRLWNLNVNDAIPRICSTTNNVLTPQQRHAYIPELPYKPHAVANQPPRRRVLPCSS